MKKLFTTLCIAVGNSAGVSAQNISCWNTAYFTPCQGATNNVTPQVGSIPGLSPSDSALPCGERGVAISDTIYFKNFTTFSGLNVNYLQIDSIYLPTGLCWSTNKSNNRFTGGEDGVILVQGTTSVLAGQYKLRLIVDANAGPGGIVNLTNQDAEQLAHLRYRVRITCPGAVCPALNTTDTVSTYIAYTDPTCVGVGVNEVSENISNLTVVPNPMTGSSSMVTFNSEIAGTYTMTMTNLLGATVSTREVEIVNGSNELTINRNNLSTGLYLLSISNGKSSITKKVTVQ